MNSANPQPARSQAWRAKLHEVIFEADTPAGKLFDVLLLLAILLSVLAVSLETVESFGKRHGPLLRNAELFFTILFTVEYILRIVAVERPRKYVLSLLGIIDLLSILPTYLSFMIGGAQSFAVLRSLRLLRVFRVFKLAHFLTEAASLRRALWNARAKIVVFFSTVLIVVTIAGTVMYEIEGRQRWLPISPDRHIKIPQMVKGEVESLTIKQPLDRKSEFTSIPQSVYWAIVTMTTVGYGDVVPQTAPGKMVAAILILLGYSLIIVPTGFVSAELVGAKSAHTVTTQVCAHCMAESHEPDARYCKLCGEQL
ncbi:MAG: ion transporter [Pirellulales bacterium]